MCKYVDASYVLLNYFIKHHNKKVNIEEILIYGDELQRSEERNIVYESGTRNILNAIFNNPSSFERYNNEINLIISYKKAQEKLSNGFTGV